jgi:hypothetical protein
MIKSKEIKWARHVASMGDTYKILVNNYERKRPLGRPTRKLEDNNSMDFREIMWEDVN